MNDRIIDFVGLMKKSGKIVLGYDETQLSVQKSKSKLILIASDISNRTKMNTYDLVKSKNIPVLRLGKTKSELAHVLGKECAVMSVNDQNLSNKITQILKMEGVK